MSRFPLLSALSGAIVLGIIGCSSPPEGDPTASGTSTSVPAESTDAFVMNAKPIIDNICKNCHSGPKPKGNIDMTKFATEVDAKANIATIHKMIEELEERKMPPPNMVPMSDDDRSKLIAALKALG